MLIRHLNAYKTIVQSTIVTIVLTKFTDLMVLSVYLDTLLRVGLRLEKVGHMRMEVTINDIQ